MKPYTTARFFAAFTWLAISLVSHAGVIATDATVPAMMNVGGTDPDPAQYIIGNAGAVTNVTSPVTAGTASDFPPPASALPDLTGTLWEYRTFSLDTSNNLPGTGFLRAVASPSSD